jgi:peroxiredoxin
LRFTSHIMKQLLFFLFLFSFAAAAAQGKPEGLFLNAKAPEFRLKDQSGVEISLKELRKRGPVVVFFYRGNWCPYCNKQLSRMQDSLQLITERGATVVAITPEGSSGVAKTLEKTKAVFSILTDADMKVANAYQVAYAVDERTQNRYKNFGIDLLENNGQKEKAYLPVPAVYVVNKEGSVVYRYFDEDYKKRPSVKELLKEIK